LFKKEKGKERTKKEGKKKMNIKYHDVCAQKKGAIGNGALKQRGTGWIQGRKRGGSDGKVNDMTHCENLKKRTDKET
jgi:hypothetical protein